MFICMLVLSQHPEANFFIETSLSSSFMAATDECVYDGQLQVQAPLIQGRLECLEGHSREQRSKS